MKITGLKSMCCGGTVRLLAPTKRKGDVLYFCLKCKKATEGYFTALIRKEG